MHLPRSIKPNTAKRLRQHGMFLTSGIELFKTYPRVKANDIYIIRGIGNLKMFATHIHPNAGVRHLYYALSHRVARVWG